MGKNRKTNKLITQGHITNEWWDELELRISELEFLMLNYGLYTNAKEFSVNTKYILRSGITEATSSNPQLRFYYNHQVPYLISKQRFQKLIQMIAKEDYLQVS